jgi:hypothetical protein
MITTIVLNQEQINKLNICKPGAGTGEGVTGGAEAAADEANEEETAGADSA